VKVLARSAAGSATARRWGWIGGAALLCAVGALAPLDAAATTAETSLQVTINGKPMTSTGPQVTASLLYDGSDQWLLTVSNAAKNPAGEDITEVDGSIDPALLRQHAFYINVVSAQDTDAADTISVSSQSGVSFSFSNAPVNACFNPPTAERSFTCPTVFGGFGSGTTQEYVITATDTDERLPLLASIDVKMKLGACTGEGHARRLASVADDDCAQPGVTKIRKATIARSAGRATFSYTAPHARTYVCELLSKKRVVGRTSCTSAHGYAHLRAGTYFFVVWGVNRAGIARKATVYGFEIG
jgi:uncharacterized protein (DUF2141 family)